MTLAPIDPTSVVAVTTYLENAKTWLATAVENTGPETIARAKAELATAAEATRQLNLSREIQDDAGEMVRRAEYALTKSLARGREEGVIWKPEDNLVEGFQAGSPRRNQVGASLPKPSDFISKGREMNDLNAMAELNADEFDKVLEEARSEGNLSRNNVATKARQRSGRNCDRGPVVTRDMRAEMIRALAEQGYTSRQMVEKVSVTEQTIREIARDFNVEIPGDKVTARSRRLDHTAHIERMVMALSNEADALKYIDFAEVDFSEADVWVASLKQSISKLRKFADRIKETTHVV